MSLIGQIEKLEQNVIRRNTVLFLPALLPQLAIEAFDDVRGVEAFWAQPDRRRTMQTHSSCSSSSLHMLDISCFRILQTSRDSPMLHHDDGLQIPLKRLDVLVDVRI